MKGLLKDKKTLIVGAIVLVLVIVLLIVFVFNGSSDKKENEVTNNTVEDSTKITDKDIEEAYDFSGQDAIKLVKEQFNSDTFEFSYTVSEDSKYIVTAKSIFEDDNTVYKFEVDPVTKSFYSVD